MSRERVHEFQCREDKVVLSATAPLGVSPDAPLCSECGKVMTKVWGLPNVNYVRKWRISMER